MVNNYAQVYGNAKETAEAAENGQTINARFAAYKTYISFLKALVSPVSINLSVSYKIDNQDLQVTDIRAVPSTYQGDTFITVDTVVMTGAQITCGTFYIKGQMVKLLAAINSFTKPESGGAQTFTFDIANSKLGAVLQKAIGKEKVEARNKYSCKRFYSREQRCLLSLRY